MDRYYKKAVVMDENDPLFSFRDHFINDENVIYLDGNSLGKLPKKTPEITNTLVGKQWGRDLIRSWNEKWLDLPANLAGKIAKIVGAHKDELYIFFILQ